MFTSKAKDSKPNAFKFFMAAALLTGLTGATSPTLPALADDSAASVQISSTQQFSTGPASIVENDESALSRQLNLPIYQWQDTKQNPKAVILAIHGLTMHGSIFDACARKLAADGAIVVAPDLRGYGAYYKGDKNIDINYEQSEKDVVALAAALRQKYKGLPVYVAGESLGGSMGIRLAAKHPNLIDGLILCSPAIKLTCSPKVFAGATLSLLHRGHEYDVSSCMKKNFSEDADITEEGITDPLIRRKLKVGDLLESCHFIAGTRHYISQIPKSMPILILQGKKDKIVKPSGAKILDQDLKATDKTVQLLPSRGHILIETKHVHEDDIKAISSWIDSERELYTLKHATLATGKHEVVSAQSL